MIETMFRFECYYILSKYYVYASINGILAKNLDPWLDINAKKST